MREPMPCPFCGGRAVAVRHDYGYGYLKGTRALWEVWCLSDLSARYQHGHCIRDYITREDAVRAWNARAREGKR